MAVPGRSRGLSQGTHAPAGSTASPQYARPKLVTSAMWPGWTDDGGGHCACTWSYLEGVRQVKFANAACPVRHGRRT